MLSCLHGIHLIPNTLNQQSDMEENAHISTFLLCSIKLTKPCWQCNQTHSSFVFVCLYCLFANDKMQNLTWWHRSLGALNRKLKIGCCIILALIQMYSSFGLLGSIFRFLASVMSLFITYLSLDCIWRAH